MVGDGPLVFSEYRGFISLLNEGGYVLDFTNHQFSDFTKEITGSDLLEECRLSKGKSIEAFIKQALRNSSVRLLRTLMDELEHKRRSNADDKTITLTVTCYQQLHELESSLADGGAGERLRLARITSEHLDEQRKVLWERAPSYSTAYIGTD